MINAKRLMELARKWWKEVSTGRTNLPLKASAVGADSRVPTKPLADKGHFIVYTMDRKRFMVPLAYLNCPIFRELFKMSEDEFGLRCDGPITLPCDAIDMDSILLLIRRHGTKVQEGFNSCVASYFSTIEKPPKCSSIAPIQVIYKDLTMIQHFCL